jgi:hypothetical protein
LPNLSFRHTQRSAMGVALIFDGVIEALQTHGVTTLH